jgi:hypothetical protein
MDRYLIEKRVNTPVGMIQQLRLGDYLFRPPGALLQVGFIACGEVEAAIYDVAFVSFLSGLG